MPNLPGKRLLLVDDTASDRPTLSRLLHLEGYDVIEANSVESALEALATHEIDYVLVDLRLQDPNDEYDYSGLEVARAARNRGVPTVAFTAFPTYDSARRALRTRGAPPLALDLISKASGPEAVLDALEACVPLDGLPAPVQEAARGLRIDLESRMVWRDSVPLDTSEKQYRLLAHLYENEGRVCTYVELYKVVYKENLAEQDTSADRRLERLVYRTRQKIEADASNPEHLLTERGRGYRLLIRG